MRDIMRMSEDDAYERFKLLRWPETKGEPICPDCGSRDHYALADRRKWMCKKNSCRLQYSVTSKTILASRKLLFRDLIGAIAIFVNGVMGVAACRMIREMGLSYKTAFVLQHKFRESMAIDYDEILDGTVEVDGAFIGTRRHRFPNKRIEGEKEFDEFLKKHPKKQSSLVVVRERPHTDPTRVARVRTVHVENEGAGIPFARQVVKRGVEMHADFGLQWEPLNLYYDMKRINHSESYSDGIACTNFAESFFSRLRCAERGVYRNFTKSYAGRYGWELAWREENSRVSNSRQLDMLISSLMRSPRSSMAGYWQRHKTLAFFNT